MDENISDAVTSPACAFAMLLISSITTTLMPVSKIARFRSLQEVKAPEDAGFTNRTWARTGIIRCRPSNAPPLKVTDTPMRSKAYLDSARRSCEPRRALATPSMWKIHGSTVTLNSLIACSLHGYG